MTAPLEVHGTWYLVRGALTCANVREKDAALPLPGAMLGVCLTRSADIAILLPGNSEWSSRRVSTRSPRTFQAPSDLVFAFSSPGPQDRCQPTSRKAKGS